MKDYRTGFNVIDRFTYLPAQSCFQTAAVRKTDASKGKAGRRKWPLAKAAGVSKISYLRNVVGLYWSYSTRATFVIVPRNGAGTVERLSTSP